MRILPRVNEDVNEEWLSDKGRFAVDGLLKRRLDRPYIRRHGKLVEASWPDALTAVAERLGKAAPERIAAIAGDLCCVESMLALKEVMVSLGVTSLDCRQDGAKTPASARSSYLFNSTIAGIDKADVVLLIGTNPRQEAPVINARLRKRYLKGGFKAGLIGPGFESTFPMTMLGEGPAVLQALVDGNHAWLEVLKSAQNPMIILGSGAVARADGLAILALARGLAEAVGAVRDDWNGFNLLQRAASRVGGLDIGFVPGPGGRDLDAILDGASKGEVEVVYLLGADEFDVSRLGNAFVIYQGHHGDAGAARADIVLPGAAYTEKNGTYVNTEGRVQLGRLAVYPPGEAKEDWRVVRALSEHLGRALPYDSLPQLRQHMLSLFPGFARVDDVVASAWQEFGSPGPLSGADFVYPIETYYMTDPISRASPTMAECAVSLAPNPLSKTGTHG